MNRFYLFFILIFLSCLLACSSSEKVQIRVVDVDSQKGLNKAQISLNKWTAKGYDWVKFATDSMGFCRFVLPKKELKHYESLELRAVKRGYYPYVDRKKYKNVVRLDTLRSKNMVLYLSNSTESVHAYYSSLVPQISVSSFVEQLKNNEYESLYLPKLTYSDIPTLLSLGSSTQRISQYPLNQRSSLFKKDYYLGAIALWIVESVRLNHGKEQRHPIECFASLNPILSQNRGDYETNKRELADAFGAYQKWWNSFEGDETSFKELAQIDPLESVGLQWR